MVPADRLRPVGAHEADGIPKPPDLGLRTGFGGDRLSAGAHACRWEDSAGGLTPRASAPTSTYWATTRGGSTSRTGDIEVVATYVDCREAGRPGGPRR
ncbi:hypothetical protein [Streptomyces virginiae]|uniref:hypothetical protein n=1 Tax=Streptomyces virginiae TaxID=1961 RepID=UPI0034263E45